MEKQSGLKNQTGLPWFQALLHFRFDLEIGAVLNVCFPPNCLNQAEQLDLCNLAFPEAQAPIHNSQSENMHFTFRIRHKSSVQDKSIAYMAASQFTFSYGFVLFRKQKDPLSKRGWKQESFVLISELNLVCFYYKITELIAQQQNDLATVFEKLFEQSLACWPWPTPGTSVTVQIKLDQTLETVVSLPESMHQTLHPDQIQRRQQRKSITPNVENPQTASSNQFKVVDDQGCSVQSNLMKTFFQNSFQGLGDELKIQDVFPGHTVLLMWNIWELVITETPFLVVGGDPREASHAILTMLSLIHPLTISADCRPYLTILNSDLEVYQDMVRQGKIPNAILGISSPLLTKNLSQFPAILRFDQFPFIEKKVQNPKTVPLQSDSVHDYDKAYKFASLSITVRDQNLVLKPQPFVFQHLDFDTPDSVTINDFNVRSHFKHLTKTFLETFEDYWKVDPQYPELLKPFVEKDFLKSLNGQNRFCRQFMLGKVEKFKSLCKKFTNTCLFHKYHNFKRKNALDQFLQK